VLTILTTGEVGIGGVVEPVRQSHDAVADGREERHDAHDARLVTVAAEITHEDDDAHVHDVAARHHDSRLGAAQREPEINLLPSHFVTYFQINSAVHSYNTRHLQDYLNIPSIRTAKRLKTLRHSGPRIWNSLPSEIKAIIIFIHLQNQLNPPY